MAVSPWASGDLVFNRIHSLARDHVLTAYDAAYLDPALENGLSLATLDADLAKACQTKVDLVSP